MWWLTYWPAADDNCLCPDPVTTGVTPGTKEPQ